MIRSLIIITVLSQGIAYGPLQLHLVALPLLLLAHGARRGWKIPYSRATFSGPGLFFIGFCLIYPVLGVIYKFPDQALQYLFYLVNLLFIYVAVGIVYSASQTVSAARHRPIDPFRTFSSVLLFCGFVGLVEVFTELRLPTSPYSPYANWFGRVDVMSNLNVDPELFEIISRTPTSFWWNPNSFAISMVLGLPFFLFYSPSRFISILLAGAVIMLIYFTNSFGALISFFFIFLVSLCNYRFRFFRLPCQSLFLISLPLVLIVDLGDFLNAAVDMLIAYLDPANASERGSIGKRQTLMLIGLAAASDAYFLGLGPAGSLRATAAMGGVGASGLTSLHNTWLEILIDAGILGFLAIFGFLMCILFRHLKMLIAEEKETISGPILLSLIGSSLGIISLSTGIYYLPFWLLVFVAYFKGFHKRCETI